MLEWFKEISAEIKAFIELPANKQVIYLIFALLFIFGGLTIYFYAKHEKGFNVAKREIERLNKDIVLIRHDNDSLKTLIFNIKVEYLNKELGRSDSLLRESEKIRKSINPVIKKVNNKINEISSN